MRPIYHRAAWSFACAFHGRRPKAGPSGTTVDLSTRQLELAESSPDLSAHFAVTEYKGDQKYMKETFGLLSQLAAGFDMPPLQCGPQAEPRCAVYYPMCRRYLKFSPAAQTL